jgi:trehalose synthase-fused probable maltokinase
VPELSENLIELSGPDGLRTWLAHQRWFAAKTQTITAVASLDSVPLLASPRVELLLAQVRFSQGTHELYQLPMVAPDGSEGTAEAAGNPGADPGVEGGGTGETLAGWTDGLVNPLTARSLMRLIDSDADLESQHGRMRFRSIGGVAPVPPGASVRPVSVEQSNTSLVVGDSVMLKVFRRLEPGINPELEMVRFLQNHGFDAMPALHGFYEFEGASLAATLGIATALVKDGSDGWELALTELIDDPQRFADRVAELGELTAYMHNTLASDSADPAFAPEEPSHETLTLLTARIDDELEQLFRRLPDTPMFEEIRARGDDVRELLALYPTVGSAGTRIRTHGDYHLGQTLYTPRGWVVLDFEGEPALALPTRRTKRSPLRDVASMLRSFDYAIYAEPMLRGRPAPAEIGPALRQRYLDAYLAAIDPSLLPTGRQTIQNVLAIHEIEKAVYELRYEIDNRPDWAAIPANAIVRLLETS